MWINNKNKKKYEIIHNAHDKTNNRDDTPVIVYREAGHLDVYVRETKEFLDKFALEVDSEMFTDSGICLSVHFPDTPPFKTGDIVSFVLDGVYYENAEIMGIERLQKMFMNLRGDNIIIRINK